MLRSYRHIQEYKKEITELGPLLPEKVKKNQKRNMREIRFFNEAINEFHYSIQHKTEKAERGNSNKIQRQTAKRL